MYHLGFGVIVNAAKDKVKWDEFLKHKTNSFMSSNCMYGWDASFGKTYYHDRYQQSDTYAQRCKENDIIEMILDLTNKVNIPNSLETNHVYRREDDETSQKNNTNTGTLKFIINGKDAGICYSHLQTQNVEYRMFSTVWYKNNEIQLI